MRLFFLQFLLGGVYFCIFFACRALEAALPAASVPIEYTLEKEGQVSLAVFDSTGQMVRPILYGARQAPGRHSVAWDGLNRYGESLPPGTYEWRLLRTPGFTRQFLVNLGINTTWSPFDVWPGNHFGPNAVYVDDKGALYIGSVSSEGPPSLLKISLDGSTKFGDSSTSGLGDGLLGITRIKDVLFVLVGDRLDLRRADNCKHFYGVPIMRRFAELRQPFADLRYPSDRKGDPNGVPNCLAGGRDVLAVSYLHHNEVRFLWPVIDKIDHEKKVTVKHPTGIAISPEGQAFVSSENSVFQLDTESGRVTPFLRDVPEPGRLAFDPAFNDLLVVSGGNCIRRYHWPEGKLIAVYGRAAGRDYGRFNPLQFEDIQDVAADGKGGFVMAEQYPRRVAHFKGRERLALVRQWFGGLQWGSLATIDPRDPTIVYLPMDHKHLGRGKIDYEARSWTLTHLYDLIDHGSWSLGKTRHRDMLPFAAERNYYEVRHAADETFLLNRGGGEAMGSVTLLRVDERNDRLVPVAHLGGLHPTLDREVPPDWWKAALRRKGVRHPEDFNAAGGYRHFAYSWSDTNRNGRVDTEEILLGSVGARMGSYSTYVGPDWEIVCPIRQGAGWTVISNEGTADLPVWNWNHARSIKPQYSARERNSLHPGCATSVHRDRDGNTYLTLNNAPEAADQRDVPPLAWPNNKYHSSRLTRWDNQGSELFSVGTHIDRKVPMPGGFADLRAILAEVKDCLVVMDACSPASVWTRDGLYAGAFTDDVGIPSQPQGWQTRAYSKAFHDDNQWGQVVETTDGRVLWGSMRDNSSPLYQVTGWDHWERQRGRIALREMKTAAEGGGTGLSAEYFPDSTLTGQAILERVDRLLGFGPVHGDHRLMEGLKGPAIPRGQLSASRDDSISARWDGLLEAPVSEEFTFRAYVYGEVLRGKAGGEVGDRVRLWIGGKPIIDSWDKVAFRTFRPNWYNVRELVSPPISLKVGERVPIRIEYASPQTQIHFHLYWSSQSLDVRHVPGTCLYPAGTSLASSATSR